MLDDVGAQRRGAQLSTSTCTSHLASAATCSFWRGLATAVAAHDRISAEFVRNASYELKKRFVMLISIFHRGIDAAHPYIRRPTRKGYNYFNLWIASGLGFRTVVLPGFDQVPVEIVTKLDTARIIDG